MIQKAKLKIKNSLLEFNFYLNFNERCFLNWSISELAIIPPCHGGVERSKLS